MSQTPGSWSSDSDSCWIATAYYGDKSHAKVIQLRTYRNELISNGFCKEFIINFNKLYHQIGKTKFGQWWSKGLSDKAYFRSLFSKFILNSIYRFSKKR